MASVVHAGWMTKSPPEKKLRKHFKIFRAQWKKRYFVLRKPSGSLPDQYELHYYKDERCLSRKGTIDLDQCEQIIEALDSDIFPHLLAIKTSYKNKMRTYYLATDTEQDMNAWVQWLCHVCGLKPEDQPTDLPDAKPGHVPPDDHQTKKQGQNLTSSNGTPDQIQPPRTARPSPSPDRERQTNATKSTPSPVAQKKHSSPSAVVQKAAEPPTPSPVVPKRPDPSIIGLESHKSSYPEQYYHQNLFGVSVSSQHSKTASTPSDGKEQIDGLSDSESEAPPLPEKRHLDRGYSGTSVEGEVFTTVSVYDHPPLSRPAEANGNTGMLYRVPPIPSTHCDRLSGGDARQIPSSYSHSPRSSLSASIDSWTSENVHAAVSTSTYDHPHSYLSSSASSDNEFPPERPPKPHHLHSPYQNLPPSGNVISAYDLMNTVPAAPKPHSSNHPLGYDIPRQSTPRSAPHTQSMLSYLPSAPPHRPPHHQMSVDSSHVYLNTTSDNLFKDLNNSFNGTVNKMASCATDAGWLSQSVPLSRTDMIGELAGSEASQSIYQHPPTSSTSTGSSVRPPVRPSTQGTTTTHRAHNGSQNHQVQEDGSAVIFSSKRTRSFKNPHSLKPVVKQHGFKAPGHPLSSMVPAPRPAQPNRTKERSSPEVDEEVRPQEPEEETHHSLSILRPVPAPGSAEPERELKYIDLAMPDSGQEPPRPVHSHTHVHGDRSKESVTEYREIDFVKTQALNDTKRLKDKERQHDDHS